ncbi:MULTISPECIES: M48 family metalloprotease [unclassified Sphingomonas]|nr:MULTISPECIES: M48 family metalloprotease [unclassified Sphingomonas]TCP66026.1 peptidase M48-like protein [Sphingomonas sp. PP-CE-1G-424]
MASVNPMLVMLGIVAVIAAGPVTGLVAAQAVQPLSKSISARGPHPSPAPAPVATAVSTLPGREADGRVERIAFRLATAGRPRCPALEPALGLVLQHLSQFELADRAGMIAGLSLDRGPGVIAVVPGGPAALAGIRPGDVLLGIDGHAPPPETALTMPFDAARAHARADAVRDLLAHTKTTPFAISLLRHGVAMTVTVTPRLACPSYIHLARSDQRNAYADGLHVFTTTGLLSTVRNDDELAFILAHEMAHNILHHAVVMRGSEVGHGIGRNLGRSGRIVRATEREADALGGTLMLDAGFDPVRGAAILGRLGGGDLGIELFAAHDSAGKRIAAMRALAAARQR